MLNETFNNVPVEQEQKDNDTIAYISANNRKPLLTIIKKEFNLNKIIMKFYQQDKIYSKILENPKAHARFGIIKRCDMHIPKSYPQRKAAD